MPPAPPFADLPFAIPQTCFDRHKWHPNIPTMFGHQDYLGEMEIIIADGKCQTSHTCTTDKQEVSNPLKVAMAKDKRIRYYDDVNVGHLGEKRNWLLDHATGDVILHFDDDDYYAPHYVRFMVDALFYSKADVIRLLSWVTYGEGFTLEPWTRYPIMEWEEQHGFGWAYSYAYTKKYGLANKFSGDKDASEEKNFVSPFQFTGTTPDVLAYGPDVLMDVRVANGPSDNMILYDHPKKDATDKPKRAKYSWMSIPDIYLSCVGRPALLSIGLFHGPFARRASPRRTPLASRRTLRIASWSCMRTTGSIPTKDCSMNEDDRKCKLLSGGSLSTEYLVHMLYDKRVLPFLETWNFRQ